MVAPARAAGQKITADMYLYPECSTGLNAAIPPSALDGGYQAWLLQARGDDEGEPGATGRAQPHGPTVRSRS